MTTVARKQRRQAAWQCFKPYLTDEQRVEAIRVLESSFQSDSTIDLINYVNKVCSDFGLDASLRKSLYVKFNQLLSTQFNLAFDPLTLLVAKQTIQPVADRPVPKSVNTVNTSLSPQTKVFATLLLQVYTGCSEQSEFFDILLELADAGKNKDLEAMAEAWAGNVYSYRWAATVGLAVQTEFVHLVYTAVCELLGPVDADNVFHKAVMECEKLPEARQFPPQRFL